MMRGIDGEDVENQEIDGKNKESDDHNKHGNASS